MQKLDQTCLGRLLVIEGLIGLLPGAGGFQPDVGASDNESELIDGHCIIGVGGRCDGFQVNGLARDDGRNGPSCDFRGEWFTICKNYDRVEEIENDADVVSAGGILPSAFLKTIGIHVETKWGTE